MCTVTETAKRYLQNHLEQIHSIEDLANALNFAPETLRKKFRHEEAIPLAAYIARTKLEHVQHLLQTTDGTCSEICWAVGWRPDSGARRFKRMTGVTMKEYRQRHASRPRPRPAVARIRGIARALLFRLHQFL